MLSAVLSTVAPSVSPVVNALASASPAVATHASSISDTLNALASRVSVADLITAAGAIVVAVQYLINQVPVIKRLSDQATASFNWVVSFALPFLATFVASAASGNNTLHVAPYVYLIAQLVYFIIEYIKSKAVKNVVAPVAAAQF